MTALPTKRAMKPAYMEQTSVNSFSSQGAQGGADDPSWTALPGQAPQLHIGYKGPMKKPQLPQDVIAEKNAELMKLARRQESKEQVRAPCCEVPVYDLLVLSSVPSWSSSFECRHYLLLWV